MSFLSGLRRAKLRSPANTTVKRSTVRAPIVTGGRSDALSVTVEDGADAEGDIISAELALLNATSSIAGFGLTASVQDARVARMVSVQLPASQRSAIDSAAARLSAKPNIVLVPDCGKPRHSVCPALGTHS